MAFISGNVSSLLLAFYGSAKKSLRLPISAGFLLFMIFNSKSPSRRVLSAYALIQLTSSRSSDVNSWLGEFCCSFRVLCSPGIWLWHMSCKCHSHSTAQCTTTSHVRKSIPGPNSTLILKPSAIASGLMISTRSFGGSVALAICESMKSLKSPPDLSLTICRQRNLLFWGRQEARTRHCSRSIASRTGTDSTPGFHCRSRC
jgi:hypothetical protein